MTIIKKETKKGQNMVESAKRYAGYYLQDVYGSYSQAKKSAWDWCYERYLEENGKNFHITGCNRMQFTVAWETAEGLRIETAYNSYLIK